jgi:hypothetical protein
MARFDFDPNEYKDQVNNFNPIPRGEYRLKAIEAEEFDTKAGDGSYIRAVFEVIDGQFARRKIFQNFNVNNPSEEAQKIGRGQIFAWRYACNRPDVMDTDQLLEIPFIGMVDIEDGKGGYGPNNRIRRFLDPNEVVKRTEPTGAYQQSRREGNTETETSTAQPAQPKREYAARSTTERKPWADDEIPFSGASRG